MVRDVIISGSLGCSNSEIMKFKILKGMRKESSKVQTLDFRQAEFGLFRELVGVIPREAALKGEVAQGSRQDFKDPPSTRAVCLNMQENEQIYEEPSLTKQGTQSGGPNIKRQRTRGGSRARLQRRNLEMLPGHIANGIRKIKAQLELRFPRDVKGNKKRFYCYISNKRLTKENVCLMLSGLGDIVMMETDKSEVLKAFFVSVCTNDISHTSVISEHGQEE